MPFKIMNHLVLDNGTSLNSLKIGRNRYKYTEAGMLLYVIKGVVPIISRGHGCIGVAVIKSLNMDENTTSVEFVFSEVDKTTAKVLYSMYLNNTTMLAGSNESDPYNQDILLPGAMGAPAVNLADEMESGSGLMDNIMRTISGGKNRNPGIRGSGRREYYDEDRDEE